MKYICALFFLIIYHIACAGTAMHFANMPFPAKADTDTLVRKQSLSAGISYGSDAIFFGRTGQFKYPYVSGDLIYNAKSGWFIYGSGIKVLGSKAGIDEIDAGAGYIFRISKPFTITSSYTRFIFDKNAQIIQSATSNDIDIKNSYDFKLFKSSITFDYLFGRISDIFTSVNVSKHIETTWNVFDDKDYLSFDPSVNMIFGTQNFVNRYDDDRHNKHYGGDPGSTLDRDAARVFNGLNYSFKIPIAYNRPHYTLEAAYKYSVPINVQGGLINHRESFLNLTFYYVFY